MELITVDVMRDIERVQSEKGANEAHFYLLISSDSLATPRRFPFARLAVAARNNENVCE